MQRGLAGQPTLGFSLERFSARVCTLRQGSGRGVPETTRALGALQSLLSLRACAQAATTIAGPQIPANRATLSLRGPSERMCTSGW